MRVLGGGVGNEKVNMPGLQQVTCHQEGWGFIFLSLCILSIF